MLKYTHTVYQLLSICQQLLNYSRVILRIHHAQVHPYSLSAAQQLPAAQLQQSNSQNPSCSITPIQFISCSAAASCSITAEQFSESIMRNHAHTVYQLLSSCSAAAQLQQSNSQKSIMFN